MQTRRRRLLGWLPAAILSVLIAGALITSGVVIQRGLAEPPPPPGSAQVTGADLSLFTDEGLAYIDRSRKVRFDFSEPRVSASARSLPANGTLVIDAPETGLSYSVAVFGGGAEPGGLTLNASELSIETDDGELVAVRVPLSSVSSFTDLLNEWRADAGTYGWDVSDADRIVEEMGEATRAGEPYSFSFGPGDALGVAVTATASCELFGCTVEFEVAPRVG